MNKNVIISCAVTGSGDSVDKHPDLPVTPEQIAQAAISSAKAGAAIVHIHVRDPQTGKVVMWPGTGKSWSVCGRTRRMYLSI